LAFLPIWLDWLLGNGDKVPSLVHDPTLVEALGDTNVQIMFDLVVGKAGAKQNANRTGNAAIIPFFIS
jgi:hypothetical protein